MRAAKQGKPPRRCDHGMDCRDLDDDVENIWADLDSVRLDTEVVPWARPSGGGVKVSIRTAASPAWRRLDGR